MNKLKTIIITGANTGLGFECAKHILQSSKNWYVIIACRNERKGQHAVEQLISETGNRNIVFRKIDLSSFQSIRDFVCIFLKGDSPPLHGIICNAGVALGNEITTTSDGIETAFQVNCLGHFLLVNLLLSHLRPKSHILIVSSELHRNDGPMKSFRPDYKSGKVMVYPERPLRPIKNLGSQRYSTTKLCLLFYCYELARYLSSKKDDTITVNAFNPGLMPDTGLGGLNKKPLRNFFLKHILLIFSKGAVSNPQLSGKILAELLMDNKYEDITGKYFDRDKIIPSSEESNDKMKGLDLWNYSVDKVGLTEFQYFKHS